MIHFLEQLIAVLWNRLRGRQKSGEEREALKLGFRIVDGQIVGRQITVNNSRRAMHLAVLGKTGTG
jgi:hypothetical protein